MMKKNLSFLLFFICIVTVAKDKYIDSSEVLRNESVSIQMNPHTAGEEIDKILRNHRIDPSKLLWDNGIDPSEVLRDHGIDPSKLLLVHGTGSSEADLVEANPVVDNMIPTRKNSKPVPTWEESKPVPTREYIIPRKVRGMEEEINPDEVEIIEKKINPDEVVVYGGGFFGPKRSDWNRMRAMFSGEDPYAAATSPENRQQLEASVNLMPDPDAERRKIAVTAYMSRMKRENVSFVYDYLDKILEEYYGKKTSVDEAYYDIAQMLYPDRSFFWQKHYRKIMGLTLLAIILFVVIIIPFIIRQIKKLFHLFAVARRNSFLLCSLALTEILLVIAICDTLNEGKWWWHSSLDSGFYMFLRFSVCGLSAWLAWKWYSTRQILCFFLTVFAVLFNPVIPIRLDRESWLLFDIIAVPLLFFSTLPLLRKQKRRTTSNKMGVSKDSMKS